MVPLRLSLTAWKGRTACFVCGFALCRNAAPSFFIVLLDHHASAPNSPAMISPLVESFAVITIILTSFSLDAVIVILAFSLVDKCCPVLSFSDVLPRQLGPHRRTCTRNPSTRCRLESEAACPSRRSRTAFRSGPCSRYWASPRTGFPSPPRLHIASTRPYGQQTSSVNHILSFHQLKQYQTVTPRRMRSLHSTMTDRKSVV